MASSIPQIYQQNNNDPILKKDIEKFKRDDYLKSKLTQLESIRPTNQKPFEGPSQH